MMMVKLDWPRCRKVGGGERERERAGGLGCAGDGVRAVRIGGDAQTARQRS